MVVYSADPAIVAILSKRAVPQIAPGAVTKTAGRGFFTEGDNLTGAWEDQNGYFWTGRQSRRQSPEVHLFRPGFRARKPSISDTLISMGRLTFLAFLLAAPLLAADPPRVFILDGKFLLEHRADRALTAAARAAADKVMTRGPYSVTQKTRLLPGGDKHDYMSQAPYWWADPAKPDGLPYIRRDGERNPEITQLPDHTNMDRVAADSQALAVAWYFTHDEKYAARAALVLRAWFLDAATRMNPNLTYAQGIPGMNDGRGTGIIESRGLTSVVDAVGLLAGSKNWPAADQQGMEQWFASFVEWLQTSKNGQDEAKAANNHGTFYDLQVADLALFARQDDLARKVLTDSRALRIAAQIEPDGRQPLETDRTRGISYSVMNLNGLILLATLGERVGVDFWDYQTPDGRSIRKALDWLVPYASGEKKWPYEQIEAYNPQDFVPALLRAAAHYKETRYAAVAKSADTSKDVPTLLLRLQVGK